MERTTPPASVTGRVLSILSVFERAASPRTLTEIAAETGLALSTAHRLLGELEDWGAVRRDENGRYQIGLRLWELGQHAGLQARELARPLLQDLYTLTRETVHLAIREGGDVLYIDRIYGSRRVPKTSRVGGRLPLHVSAVGKVLLAFEEDWVRTAILQQPLERRTPHAITDPHVLSDELDGIRRSGFSITVDEVTVGSTSIARVSRPVQRHPPADLVRVCRASVRRVSGSRRDARERDDPVARHRLGARGRDEDHL